jgi:pentatricopeptide repeat protein
MICGYALHGQGLEALKMFERMQKENVMPNHATFVAVLRACIHVGLLDDGCRYFHLMTTHYKLELDRCRVPDLSVSGDNFDWWTLTLTIRLRRASPKRQCNR